MPPPRDDIEMPAARQTWPRRSHVFIVDGTLSSLTPGQETNAGLTYKLLSAAGPSSRLRVAYHPGVQGEGWRKWVRAASGHGVNDAIIAGYSFLCSGYRKGDQIYLFGYSRGAYAVRSLAGLINNVGMMRRRKATERRIFRAFRYYEAQTETPALQAFRQEFCHTGADVEMIGVWDTVKSLGLPYPGLSRLAPMATEFHDHHLGDHIRRGYHALALDEDRVSFQPVFWRRSRDWTGELSQTWFPGSHGDVGGFAASRPLSNLSLVWMLERAKHAGLKLPKGWRKLFPVDPTAPVYGSRAGIGRLFLTRAPRSLIDVDGAAIHPSVLERIATLEEYRPASLAPEAVKDTPLSGDFTNPALAPMIRHSAPPPEGLNI